MREQQLLPLEKKYIEVTYNPATQDYMREYCLNNEFDLTNSYSGDLQDPEEFNFHTTIWFTESEHQIKNRLFEIEIEVIPTGFALFGENKDTLVLEIESTKLIDLYDYYGNKYNMEGRFPNYRPHITLSYNYHGELPTSPLPDTQLIADRLKIKKQQD